MAFVTGIGSNRTNVAPRTAEGAKGVVWPATSNTERHLTLAGCRTCAKREQHGAPCVQMGMAMVYGNDRTTGMTETERMSATFVTGMETALWVAGYVGNGVPYQSYLYNLGFGTANNITQQVDYEILSVSGDGLTMTLRGPNPKFIGSPRSVVNANWPFEADSSQRPPGLTDEQWEVMKWARIITGTESHALPVGAGIVFAWPSVLFGKCYPYITRVDWPESDEATVTFTVGVSRAVVHAREPYDAAQPATVYRCTVFFYYVAPEYWGNVQVVPELLFAPRTREMSRAAIEGAGNWMELTRTSGGHSRVTGTTRLYYDEGGGWAEYVGDVSALLEVTWTGSEYQSRLDLTDLLDLPELERVKAVYWAEAEAGDTRLVPQCRTCANDQLMPWEESRRCMDHTCEKFLAGGYVAGNCWGTTTPDATGFALGTEVGAMPISDGQVSGYWAGWWNRCSMIVEQSQAGESSYRNFSFSRPAQGGPSLAELVGGYFDQVPTGRFPTRRPLFLPTWGQLREWEDVDGDNLELIHGLYEARTWYQDEFGTWIDKGFVGALEEFVSGWSARTDARGVTLDGAGATFPSGAASYCGLYDYATGGNNMAAGKRYSAEVGQMFLENIGRDDVDAEVEAMIGGMV